MNNCRAKAQRRAEKAHSLVGQDIMPFGNNLNRNRRRSDRSSTGCQSSLSSSFDTFFSGAWSSVSDFFEDITEKGEDAMKDFKRKIHQNTDDKDRGVRRKSAKKRYRELYSNKLQFATEKDIIADSLGAQEFPIVTDTAKDSVFENIVLPCKGDNISSDIVNARFETTCKPFRSENDNVERWFSSKSNCHCPSQISSKHVYYNRTNSDQFPRKFSNGVFSDVNSRLADAKSLQTLHHDDFIDTFKLKTYSPPVSYENIEPDNQRKTQSNEFQLCKSPNLDNRRKEKDDVDQCFGNLSPPTPIRCSDKNIHNMDSASSLGTINLVIEYIAQSKMLKLTVKGMSMKDNVHRVNKDSSIFIKVYMTLADDIKKAYSKATKRKNLTSFNQELFLEIDDPESAILPLMRLVICKRKTLFSKYRYKHIAETLFYVNKDAFCRRIEISKFLTECI